MQNILFFIKENMILFSIWFFFLIIIIFFITKKVLLGSKIINNLQAIKLINQDNAIVIDTRSSEIFAQGHIINSINISLKNIFSENLKEIEAYKSCPIILVLNELYLDNKIIKKFLKNGFNKNIYILKNGLYHWNLENLPLVIKDT